MHRALVAASLLASLTLPLRQAEGQAASTPSLTGPCAQTDSVVDLGDVVEQPDQPPVAIPAGNGTRFPASLRRPGYSGSVAIGFVVNADGKVRPRTATVLSSTDTALTRFACEAVREVRFTPAMSHGHAVAAQKVMPFTLQMAKSATSSSGAPPGDTLGARRPGP